MTSTQNATTIRYLPFTDCLDDDTALLNDHRHDVGIDDLTGYVEITLSCENAKVISTSVS